MGNSKKTRKLIIEKAAILFNQKGFHGTAMSDIMKATGLTKGGIYGNFKKESGDKKGVKEEIAVAAFEYGVAFVGEEIRKRTTVVESSIDKLKTIVYFYKERILNPPLEGGCPIMNTAIE
ncbi:MAG: TetR/AcrR family transcriptional regulator, partial [Saprospiraceae bacterium]